MQRGAGAAIGSEAEIVLEPDTGEPTVLTPPELARLLRHSKSLQKWHDQLSPSIRKFLAAAVAQPKSPEARAKAAELIAERMYLAMEGERRTPPILEAAFQRYPQARQGWLALTPIQRRSHLLAIFYYRSPESRQKRAQQAVEHALRIISKRQQKPDNRC